MATVHRPGPPVTIQGMNYAHLGRFSDWVEFAHQQNGTWPGPGPAKLTTAVVRDVLGFTRDQPPLAPRVEGTWSRDGVEGEEVSWSVGYGPRTQAWLLRPTGAPGPLPGVLALHDHSGFKYFGKEKIADGPGAPGSLVVELRRAEYGGTAFANELARQGFTVLVHDVFLWGSRRFDMDEMVPPGASRSEAAWLGAASQPGGDEPSAPSGPLGPSHGINPSDEIRAYNLAAVDHEHVVAKYCNLLSTSLTGVIAYEDRVALEYLKSRHDVVDGRLGCIGLSGGGCRAAVLQATSEDVSASVVVCLMSTYDQWLDRHVAPHSWMTFPPGLAAIGDWPDLAACRAPSPLLVQYTRDDHLFSRAGMEAAHEKLGASYLAAGAPEAYVGQFYDGPHCFDRAMQAAAFAQLALWLGQD
jgi:dienelactone hydrolase